ncbi:MAG: hypothetical protein HUU55_23850 [Myxococcales bacterium]|nr:hypothetical protein [Myxococcales bacterium]
MISYRPIKFLSSASLIAFLAIGCAGETQSTSSSTSPSKSEPAVSNAGTGADEVRTAAVAAPTSAATGICKLSGTAGSTIDCAVRVIGKTDSELATAFQATLKYDANIAQFVGFVDRFCPTADNCIDRAVDAQSSNLSATGHTFAFAPQNPGEWNGEVRFLAANLSNPDSSVSTARVGDPNNDGTVVRARFQLKQAVDAANSADVTLSNVVASSAQARELNATVVDNSIVTGGVR